MRILYEGGGTMFSNVVDLAMRTEAWSLSWGVPISCEPEISEV